MKRIIAVLMLLTLMIGLFTGCSQKSQTSAEQVIKIGILEPFTGKNASGGKQEALGIAYANSLQPTVTINGTTYKVISATPAGNVVLLKLFGYHIPKHCVLQE